MSQWVRLWEDMPTDPKWRVIARRAGRPISEVLSVFCFMLTNAGSSPERGSLCNWDDEDVAAALDIDAEHVVAIREAMQGKTLDGDRLSGWERRQPRREDDKSHDRVKAFRERQASMKRNETHCNALIAPDTDTDTDTEQMQKRAPARDEFELECRKLVEQEPVLLALDFHALSALLDEGVTREDVFTGIRAAMEKPGWRIRHWSQLAGWARGAAKERLAGRAKISQIATPPPTREERDAALAKAGRRWVAYDTDEWVRVADRYKTEHGKYPPHPAGGWYFDAAYFAPTEVAA